MNTNTKSAVLLTLTTTGIAQSQAAIASATGLALADVASALSALFDLGLVETRPSGKIRASAELARAAQVSGPAAAVAAALAS